MDTEIEQSLLKLDVALTAEWQRIAPDLDTCLERGDYDMERILRGAAFERQRELIQQWQAWRVTLPPFTTKERGYYQRHPITPENRHLLSPTLQLRQENK